MNETQYEEHVKSLHERSIKTSKADLSRNEKEGESTLGLLCVTFGEKTLQGNEGREAKVRKFQDDTSKMEFKNRGQFHDYGAEGILWLILNGRLMACIHSYPFSIVASFVSFASAGTRARPAFSDRLNRIRSQMRSL